MFRQYEHIPAAELLCEEAAEYNKSGDIKAAFNKFKMILEEYPFYPRAYHAKAVLLHKGGEHEEAISVLNDCISRNPGFIDAINSLGNVYRFKYCFDDAVACYEKILLIDNNNYRAYFNLGEVLQKELNETKALKMFKKCVECNPLYVPAYLAVIRIYKKKSKLVQAVKLCNKVLKLDPFNAEATFMVAAVKAEYGFVPESIRYMEKIKHSESFGLSAHASIIYYLNLLPEITQEQIYMESIHFAERFSKKYEEFQTPHANCPDPHRKLRIGFVSGDIKLHPVARHLRPLIQNISRDQFELYAYNNFNIHDDVTEDFKSLFCYWRNIHEISDEKVVEMIRLDTIDILFDLSGYTGCSRLILFARKPAPIQISWIGYFNTTGFPTMDYLISDDITIRPEEEKWFSEHILRMSCGRFCYEPRKDILPEVAPLPAKRNGYITFGAFNKVNKLNSTVLSAWSNILKSVPGSKLILKWPSYKDKTLIRSLTHRFNKFGILPEQLEFRPESGYIDLLKEYTNDIDIVLDTFPHSGGATSCDSLCMGVPVVTLSGATPISRQTHGFLKLMGYEEELVAFSTDEYQKKAIGLAGSLTKLKYFRGELRDKFMNSPICDGASFTKEFEAEMRRIWHQCCDGKSIDSVLSKHPLNSNELFNEGIIQMDSGEYRNAIKYFEKTIELDPKNDRAFNNLGICCWSQGYIERAEQLWRRGRKLNNHNDDICCNLAGVMLHKKRYHVALSYCMKGLQLTDKNLDLYLTKASALQGLGRFFEAHAVLIATAEKFPCSSKVHSIIGSSYAAMGNVDQAVSYYRRSAEMDSSNSATHSNLLFMMNNSDCYTQREIYEEALNWDRHHSLAPLPNPYVSVKENGRLRVGLVSADFNRHPGGMLFAPFMEHYSHELLEVYCFYNNQRQDTLTSSIKSHADRWHDVTYLSDKELYDLIQKDKIDLLIDMNGHTDKSRLRLFSMKPCAVQATWIGYFNTTGVCAIDYFISDEFTTPGWMQAFFSEKIVRIPNSRFCYSAPEYSPLVSLSPSEWKGYITFGAFNNGAKLSDTTIKMWAQVLKSVPKSRLILKWKAFKDKDVKERLLERFQSEGVGRHRISTHGSIVHAQMLADYSDVDIVLDTFPFNGGMTSIEALWMGVPIITMTGSTPASRQTGSFLRLLGLDDLVTDEPGSYVEAAVKLASERERLYEIRGTLRQRMKKSPLMNGELFARNLEKLFMSMYQEQNERLQAGRSCRI